MITIDKKLKEGDAFVNKEGEILLSIKDAQLMLNNLFNMHLQKATFIAKERSSLKRDNKQKRRSK